MPWSWVLPGSGSSSLGRSTLFHSTEPRSRTCVIISRFPHPHDSLLSFILTRVHTCWSLLRYVLIAIFQLIFPKQVFEEFLVESRMELGFPLVDTSFLEFYHLWNILLLTPAYVEDLHSLSTCWFVNSSVENICLLLISAGLFHLYFCIPSPSYEHIFLGNLQKWPEFSLLRSRLSS